MESDEAFYYTFRDDKTFFHLVFKSKTADRIVSIVWNKWVLSLWFVARLWFFTFPVILGTKYQELPDHNSWQPFVMYIIGAVVFGLSWTMMAWLTLNRTALRIVVSSFEWWFKLSQIVSLWAAYIMEDYLTRSRWNYFELKLISHAILCINDFSMIVLFASLDAVNPKIVSPKKQSFLLFVNVVWFSGIILNTYMHIESDPYEMRDAVTIEFSKQSISMWDVRMNAAHNLFIFYGKQFAMKLWRSYRQSDKPCSMKYTPSVRWLAPEIKQTIPTNPKETNVKAKAISIVSVHNNQQFCVNV